VVRRSARPPRVPRRPHRRLPPGRPAGLGGTGPRRRHAVLDGPSAAAIRPVARRQRRRTGPRVGVHRLRHGARRRRAAGAAVGTPRRGPRRRGGRRMTADRVPPDLRAAYAECRRLTRAHGTTYFWATQLLPVRCRAHVYALYGFCRYADDIVDSLGDEPVDRRAAALGRLGESLRAAFAGTPSDEPVVAAVAHTAATYGIEAQCFE